MQRNPFFASFLIVFLCFNLYFEKVGRGVPSKILEWTLGVLQREVARDVTCDLACDMICSMVRLDLQKHSDESRTDAMELL